MFLILLFLLTNYILYFFREKKVLVFENFSFLKVKKIKLGFNGFRETRKIIGHCYS
jgi:hypothetical protein